MSREKAVFVAVTLLALTVLVVGQTQTGSISGTVVDPSNAVVVDATVSITNTGTGQTRELQSSSQGIFVFDRLAPGVYSLKISKKGFRTTEVKALEVAAGKSSNIGVARLEVGAISEMVEVTAGTVPLVETQSAQLSGTFSAAEVKNLRSGMNGLDQMALLTPGVTPGFGNINANGMQVSANGQRSRSTQFTMDGLQMNDITIGGPSFFLQNYDAIAEYQVVTNQFSAELGRNLGATVNVISKSGTNSIHGSVNWGYQASSLDAKSSLQVRNNVPKPKYLNNTWSANLGGPLLKDHVFYYLSYRGRTQTGQTTDIGVQDQDNAITANGINALTAAFPSSVPLRIYKQSGPFAIPDGNPRCVPGTTQIKTFSDGTTTVPTEVCAPQRNRPLQTKDYEYWGKLDFNFGQHSVSARFGLQNETFCCSFGTSPLNGYWISVPNRNHSAGLIHTWNVTPRFTNYLRINWARFLVAFEGGNTKPITQVHQNLTNVNMISGFLGLGLATNLPQNRLLNTSQLQESFTWVKGRHTLKGGAEFNQNHTSLFFLPFINGSFLFTQTNLSDFINNTPNTVSFAAGPGTFAPAEFDHFYYFQDDFRLRSNLTINLGLRYERFGQPINDAVSEVLRRESDPNQAFWLQSLPLEARTIPKVNTPSKNFAPRVGFAWTPDYKNWLFGDHATVIRAGYGIAYDIPFYNILLNMTTAAPRVFLFSLTKASAIPIPGNGLGSDVAAAIPVPRNTRDPRAFAQTTVPTNFHEPYGQNWTLGVQRELGRTQVMEVRYVGTNSIGQFQSINLNPKFTRLAADFPQFVPSGLVPCPTATANGFGRVDCNFGPVRQRRNSGFSNYNSLQVRYDTRNLWKQLTAGAAYTWAKGIDNVSEVFGFFNGGARGFSQNPFDFSKQERGESNFSLRHTLTFHYVWELPWFRSQQGILGRIAGGWQLSGTTTVLGGRPFTAAQRTGNSYCGEDTAFNAPFDGFPATCRPFLATATAPLRNVGFVDSAGVIHLGSLAAPTTTTIDQVHWLFNNDNAIRFFTNTPFGVGRNTLVGAYTQDWDMAVDKKVKVSERINLRYRLTMLDVFNHRNWGVPPARVDLASFADPHQNDVGPLTLPIPGARSIRMGLWAEF